MQPSPTRPEVVTTLRYGWGSLTVLQVVRRIGLGLLGSSGCCAYPEMLIAGALNPAKVSVYSKLSTLLVTSGVQFGFGQVNVAKNSSVLVPVVLCSGTSSLPFLVDVMTDEVDSVMDSENGSTTMLLVPGLWQTPLIVDVTDRVTVASVLPTPSIAVAVQVTVVPEIEQ